MINAGFVGHLLVNRGDAGSESDVLGSCVALAFVNAKIPEDLF